MFQRSVLSAALAAAGLTLSIPLPAHACDCGMDDEPAPAKPVATQAGKTRPTSSASAVAGASATTMALAATAASQAAPAAAAQGAQPAAQLGRVEVTSRRDKDKSTLTQPDVRTARERIQTTPGGVSVIDADSYRDARVANLADALAFAPGVLAQPRFGAEETRLSIRGSGLQRTFHGRGLKLMQDGVPMNLADGGFDFQAIDALSARYIEVWRGANALQYGAATLGGAINFVSPNGFNSDAFNVRQELGSFGYRRTLVSGGYAGEHFDAYLAANLFAQDGFRRHAVQDTRRLFANLGWMVDRTLETRFYIGWADSDSELPGSITKAQLNADPRAANPANITGDQKRDIRWTRVSNKTVWAPDARQRMEVFWSASDKHLFHPIFQVIDQKNRDATAEVRYVNSAPVFGLPQRATLGYNPARGTTDEDRWVNVGGQRGARTNASRQIARTDVLYAESQLSVLPALQISAGLARVSARRQLEDRFIAGTPADPVSESFNVRYSGTVPKLGAIYALGSDAKTDIQLFGNWSASYEPPSFGELAGGLRPVITRAQRGKTLEVGTRGSAALGSGTLQWDVAAYEARITDELLQIATNVVGASITVNAPRTLRRGLELGVGGQHGALDWRAVATLSRNTFDGDPAYGNRPLPGLPERTARLEAGWRFGPALRLSANAQHASGQAVDFARSWFADAYTVYGLRAGGEPNKHWKWFIEGRNLANTRYASTTGVVRDAAGRDTAQFLPGDGRAVYAGIEFKFN
jgi:iron complex outermembrane receptor protein